MHSGEDDYMEAGEGSLEGLGKSLWGTIGDHGQPVRGNPGCPLPPAHLAAPHHRRTQLLPVGEAVAGLGQREHRPGESGRRAAGRGDVGAGRSAVAVLAVQGHVEVAEVGPALGRGRQRGTHHGAEQAGPLLQAEGENEGAGWVFGIDLGQDQLAPVFGGAVEGQEVGLDREGGLVFDVDLDADVTGADDRAVTELLGLQFGGRFDRLHVADRQPLVIEAPGPVDRHRNRPQLGQPGTLGGLEVPRHPHRDRGRLVARQRLRPSSSTSTNSG